MTNTYKHSYINFDLNESGDKFTYNLKNNYNGTNYLS